MHKMFLQLHLILQNLVLLFRTDISPYTTQFVLIVLSHIAVWLLTSAMYLYLTFNNFIFWTEYLQKKNKSPGWFSSFSCFQDSVDFLSLNLQYSCGKETDFYMQMSEFQVPLWTVCKWAFHFMATLGNWSSSNRGEQIEQIHRCS